MTASQGSPETVDQGELRFREAEGHLQRVQRIIGDEQTPSPARLRILDALHGLSRQYATPVDGGIRPVAEG